MRNRRSVLKNMALMPFVSLNSNQNTINEENHPLKISLNAFSFDKPLKAGQINLFQVLDFCAENNFDGVDLTAYYFPGYPNVPDDDYLFRIKRKAHKLGLRITGTGVRNDFTNPEKAKREEDIKMVKNWIVAAEKLGAPVIRIFAGNKIPEGYTWEQTATWMVEDFKTCVEFGKKHGIIVGVQNHYDFIQTPEHVEYFMEKVNDEWFGLILDTGSYRNGETYKDIEESITYAVNWQVKEKIFVKNKELVTDLARLMKIIKKSEYRGYLPIETLGEGDPGEKIRNYLAEVRKYI